jgi:hypothetical protein
VKRIYKNSTTNYEKLLVFKVSVSINIHSKNTPHLYDGFLMSQKEHDPVYVKSVIESFIAYQ